MTDNMRMSKEGIEFLIQKEGVRTKAYRDTVGVWTIGVGHTSAAGPPKVVPGMVISSKEVYEILDRDIRKFEKYVNDGVKVPLTQNQFDALVSICFNIGGPAFLRSTFLKRINNRESTKRIVEAILWWNKPPEIRGRRKKEADLFAKAGSLPPKEIPSVTSTVTPWYVRLWNWILRKK